jgi:hypothetical protein
MNESIHERAGRLIAESWVEGISPADHEWLNGHLDECAPCAALAEATDRAVRSLRSVSVRVDPGLVNRTRLSVFLRACELRQRRVQMLPLWISCALSWVLGAVSAPYVWRGFEWVGRRVGVPDLMWQTAFVLWWTLPALAAVAIVTIKKPQATE